MLGWRLGCQNGKERTGKIANQDEIGGKPVQRFELSWQGRYLVIGALAVLLVLMLLQFSTPSICCGDFDGYYHIRWSQILWQGLRHGHLPSFTWLPLTTLGPSTYADQHFLFHVLLIPFTWFGNLRFGAKIATTLFSGLAVFSLYGLVVRYRIRYPLLWLLALLGCSWVFYVRLNMTKALGLSLLFIVVGIWLLLERKYKWLAPAAFLYVWSYNLFVMLGILALIWVGVLWWSEKRIEWRPLLWTGVGTIAGLVVNPYFPHNLALFFSHVLAKSGQMSVTEGAGLEWYSPSSWDFLTSSAVACAAMVIGFVAFGYALSANRHQRVRNQRSLLFLLFSGFLLLISTRSNRFLEYWPPFAVLFAAFTLQSVWQNNRKEGAGEPAPDQQWEIGPGWNIVFAGVTILLGAAFVSNVYAARSTILSATKGPDHYQAGAGWLLNNVPPGALIYDVNWSDFPKLFFYDTNHSYVSGLDPLYLHDQHPNLVQLNDRLSSREEKDPAGAIRSAFADLGPSGVSYIFVGDYPAPPPPEWLQYIRESGGFEPVYRDKECFILRVVEKPEQIQAAQAAPAPTAPPREPPSSGAAPSTQPVRHWDSPEQRKKAAMQIRGRFGGDIYGSDEEDFEGGGPALVVHNKKATEQWARNLFMHDAASKTGEALWQLGFRSYVVTDEVDTWGMKVLGNPTYRSLFDQQAAKEPQQK